jgi:membrane protein
VGALSPIVLSGVIQDWLGTSFGISSPEILWGFAALRDVIIMLALLLAFAVTCHIAPIVRQHFALITPGSVVGTITLSLASLGFALYTANFADYRATYGSIGAVIVLMFCLYIAGLLILFGSEINLLA